MTEHLDQTIDAEAVSLAAYQIADSRLRYLEELGGSGLREAALVDQLEGTETAVGQVALDRGE